MCGSLSPHSITHHPENLVPENNKNKAIKISGVSRAEAKAERAVVTTWECPLIGFFQKPMCPEISTHGQGLRDAPQWRDLFRAQKRRVSPPSDKTSGGGLAGTVKPGYSEP